MRHPAYLKDDNLAVIAIRLANIMAAKTAMGPISDRKVGSSNIVKVTKVVAERPRFTIISTKRKGWQPTCR